MREQLSLLPGYLTAHLTLSMLALLCGVLVSVPLGIWASRRPRLEMAVLGVASVIQTIPSLALLAFMVPALAALSQVLRATAGIELRSIGFLPALLALTLYSLLPVLRNTVIAIAGVDPALREAAAAVGMTDGQRLRRVELPLALPVIVAGLRTAAVWVVGMATLSTPVGAPSLGNYIFTGLQTRNHAAVLLGCVAAALLALLLDNLIRLVEVGLLRRRRALTALGVAAFLALYAYVGAAALLDGIGGARPVRIGAKTFTEQYILGRLLAQQVSRRTGLAAVTVPSLGSTVAFSALQSGDIDAYVDYSGTLFATVMRRQVAGAARADVLREVTSWLQRDHGITVVGSLGFENTYALAMREERARDLGIRTISDLARFAEGLEVGGDYEIFGRQEWAALRTVYGLRFRSRRTMEAALMYEAARSGEVDVITAFSTDGRLAAYGLRVLVDDRGAILPYDALILAGPRLPGRRHAVTGALAELVGKIDGDTMRGLNAAVDRDGRTPTDVAAGLLRRLDAGRPAAPRRRGPGARSGADRP